MITEAIWLEKPRIGRCSTREGVNWLRGTNFECVLSEFPLKCKYVVINYLYFEYCHIVVAFKYFKYWHYNGSFRQKHTVKMRYTVANSAPGKRNSKRGTKQKSLHFFAKITRVLHSRSFKIDKIKLKLNTRN